MRRELIKREYFRWLADIVCGDRFAKEISYRKLLEHLHDTRFRWDRHIPNDENRAEDGIGLRYRFANLHPEEDRNYIIGVLGGSCSILEMMVGMVVRCEENITDDPAKGNRTGQWFWIMIVNLGLGSMVDSMYEARRVDEILERLLDRTYDPDGRGGLFTLKSCPKDCRDMEIWDQLMWYLDENELFYRGK